MAEPREYDPDKRYIYQFVRKDIPVVAQLIQLGHAADRIALAQDYYEGSAYTCLFEVDDQAELMGVCRDLLSAGLKPGKDFEMFYDQHWPIGYNAIATRPFIGQERALFSIYRPYRSQFDDVPEAQASREKLEV